MIFIRYWAIAETLSGIAGSFATELTDLERQYLHKRIAEEYFQLERLEKSWSERQSDVVMTAEAVGKRTDRQSASSEP